VSVIIFQVVSGVIMRKSSIAGRPHLCHSHAITALLLYNSRSPTHILSLSPLSLLRAFYRGGDCR